MTRRTWAPRGQTPVIRRRSKWQRVSMAARLCYGSRGGGAQVAFHSHPDAYDTDSLIQALGEELAILAGDTLADITAATERGIQRIQGTPHQAFSFLRHCGLSLW